MSESPVAYRTLVGPLSRVYPDVFLESWFLREVFPASIAPIRGYHLKHVKDDNLNVFNYFLPLCVGALICWSNQISKIRILISLPRLLFILRVDFMSGNV